MNAESLLLQLKEAFNRHDVELLTACFHIDYISEQPIHPNRFFKGRDTVEKNWASNFNEMPDFSVRLLNFITDEKNIWAEWEWHGTRKDASVLEMRGITIFELVNETIHSARLYMEPVEKNSTGIETAVKQVMHGK